MQDRVGVGGLLGVVLGGDTMSDNFQDFENMAAIIKAFRAVSRTSREFLLKKLDEEHNQIGDKADDIYSEIKRKYHAAGGRFSKSNGFIQAIKEVRNLGGLGLKEAKDLVETW